MSHTTLPAVPSPPVAGPNAATPTSTLPTGSPPVSTQTQHSGGGGSPPTSTGNGAQQQPPAPLDPVALMVRDFWSTNHDKIDQGDVDFKYHPLPLARIKKVMKSDPDIKQMISSEAPLIFSKACELFIAELTLRAWMVAEENKRRTLQRGDIMVAVSKSDQYDFLIDIIPREDPDALTKKRYTKDNQQSQQTQPSIPGMHNPFAAAATAGAPGFPVMGHMPYAPMPLGPGAPYLDPSAAAAAMSMGPSFGHFHSGAPGMSAPPPLPPGFLPHQPTDMYTAMQQGFLASQNQQHNPSHQQQMSMFAPHQMQPHQQQQQQQQQQQATQFQQQHHHQAGAGVPGSTMLSPTHVPSNAQAHSIPMVSPPPGQMQFGHSATPPTPGSAKHPSGGHPLYSPPSTSMAMHPSQGPLSAGLSSQFTTPPTSATYPMGQGLMHRSSGEPTPQSATFAPAVMSLDHTQFQQHHSVGATPLQTPHSATFGGAQFAPPQHLQQQQHTQGLAAMLGAMGGRPQQQQHGGGNGAADGTGGAL